MLTERNVMSGKEKPVLMQPRPSLYICLCFCFCFVDWFACFEREAGVQAAWCVCSVACNSKVAFLALVRLCGIDRLLLHSVYGCLLRHQLSPKMCKHDNDINQKLLFVKTGTVCGSQVSRVPFVVQIFINLINLTEDVNMSNINQAALIFVCLLFVYFYYFLFVYYYFFVQQRWF